jgi:formylglycine-generating enzyme
MKPVVAILACTLAASCSDGSSNGSPPTLVQVPGGSFSMGADRDIPEPWASYERPVHQRVVAPFFISAHEVTVGEFAAFASSNPIPKGCWVTRDGKDFFDPSADWRNPGFPQTERHPVVCVSWHDAMAYAVWRGARLPTEAEFEYAAGEFIPCAANVYDVSAAGHVPWMNFQCSDGFPFTAPVGSFPANHFNLHDMLGNVHEWTSDCFTEGHGAPPDCAARVSKGGAWRSPTWVIHRSERSRTPPDIRNYYLGFRLAR